MDEQTQFDKLVGLIYEAALDQKLWSTVVEALCGHFEVDVAHLIGWDIAAGTDRLGIITPKGQAMLTDYQQHYGGIDPRLSLAASLAPGEILACHEHFDAAFVSRSEFYQDFLLPRAGRYSMGVKLLHEGSIDFQLGLTRTADLGAFEADEQKLLGRLIPHLQRSLRLLLHTQAAQGQASCTGSVMALSHLGVLALSDTGELLYANAKGDTLLRDQEFLKLQHGHVHAVDTEHDAQLQAAIKQTAQQARPHNLSLGKTPTGRHCCVTVLAASESQKSGFPSGRISVIALITDGGNQRVATARQLMSLFGLSPAEARLARALAQGESIESYATAAGLKRTTVRTQLYSALAKTATCKQKDLVRLLLSVPAVRE
ncbi:MAG: hypothetical protein PHD37_17410 [Gallionellaceae bacterium]|nr:hypothetical protein [Gallionellaceae bacterium]